MFESPQYNDGNDDSDRVLDCEIQMNYIVHSVYNPPDLAYFAFLSHNKKQRTEKERSVSRVTPKDNGVFGRMA